MNKGHRGDWLYEAEWGVMCHFLGTPELTSHEWNRRVDGFDTEALTTQLEYTGARYFLFTVGQNFGHYCSSNAAYDYDVPISNEGLLQEAYIAQLREVHDQLAAGETA